MCYADSSNCAVAWKSSTSVEQVDRVADGVVDSFVVGSSTVDRTIAGSIECCNAAVDAVGDSNIVGDWCSASVHHDSLDRVVRLVHNHLFGSECCAVVCWSVDACGRSLARCAGGGADGSCGARYRAVVGGSLGSRGIFLSFLSGCLECDLSPRSRPDCRFSDPSRASPRRLIPDDLARPPVCSFSSTCA